jgi:hypothetical protein
MLCFVQRSWRNQQADAVKGPLVADVMEALTHPRSVVPFPKEPTLS